LKQQAAEKAEQEGNKKQTNMNEGMNE